jgi:23S rRNA pseudouridine1911/1915/1917 synthase
MAANDVFNFNVAPPEAGMRLDALVAAHLKDCSRSYAAVLIRQGNIQVDGAPVKPSYSVKSHDQITIQIPLPEPVALVPEPMPLDIFFEDRHIIVINKPSGMVVHPAAGHASGTLVNGILHHCPDLEGIGGEQRPGIVHRLDKDTSGIMVVAKTAPALQGLSQQFKGRTIAKQYLALVHGTPDQAHGTIDLPVGRHPIDRKKMSTISHRGRQALTLWRIKERFPGVALLAVDLKTGRTHQIRVHCKAMGHPVLGDPVYGPRKRPAPSAGQGILLHQVLKRALRQMLHAFQLGFAHPATGQQLMFEAPIPKDMAAIIEALRKI